MSTRWTRQFTGCQFTFTQRQNGKWVFGHDYWHPCGGSCASETAEFQPEFDSEQEVKDYAADHALRYFRGAMKNSCLSDSGRTGIEGVISTLTQGRLL
jgi:hypothetical protein